MAWTWLTVAAKSIPWGTIVRRTPDIIDAASNLLAKREVKRSAEVAASQAEAQLAQFRERLSELEDHDQETARVVNQIAQQTQDISIGMEVLAAKIRLLTILYLATVVTAIVIVGVAVSG